MKRPLSLQTRVAIASGLAAGIVIAAIGIAFAVFLRVNGSEQLERTLDSVTLGAVVRGEIKRVISRRRPRKKAGETGELTACAAC